MSVWGCPVEVEHHVLSAVIASFGSYDKLPPDLFGPDAPPHGCFLSTVAGMKRGMLPMFGGELKIQLDIAVTVPLVAPSVAEAGPPVREAARIGVDGLIPRGHRGRTLDAATRLPAPRVPGCGPLRLPPEPPWQPPFEALPPPKKPPPASRGACGRT